MVNRGVFQARKSLKPADAIILGKLLDADALMVNYIEDRFLKMKVYDAENGYLLWESEYQFHPAVSIDEQLSKNCEKLAAEFLRAMPYQGFTIYDEANDRVLIEKDKKVYAKVFVGGMSEVQTGDMVQWLSLKSETGNTLLQKSKAQVIADGLITEINGDEALVELQNISDEDLIQENTLVRFPKEMAKLRDLFSREAKNLGASAEYLSHDLKPVSELHKETQSSSTGLAFFFSLVGFILLAF